MSNTFFQEGENFSMGFFPLRLPGYSPVAPTGDVIVMSFWGKKNGFHVAKIASIQKGIELKNKNVVNKLST